MSSRGVAAEEEKRVITSAIESMTVAEVRKSLAYMRKKWDQNMNDAKAPPFYPSDDIGVKDMNVEEFALLFAIGHHRKRCQKQKGTAPPTCGTECQTSAITNAERTPVCGGDV
jgi:hypothetical protein